MKRHRLHVAIACCLLTACAAQHTADTPARVEATVGASTAAPSQPAYPGQGYPQQQYGTPPPFGLPAPTDLAGNEAALDLHEREVTSVLDANAAVQLSEGDRCAIVCRALQSMRQSAEHICGLAQDRCESARARVRKAEARAKDACPACTTPT